VRIVRFHFNTIWVIDSIPIGQLNSPRRSIDEINDKAPLGQVALRVERRSPNTRLDLIEVLDEIAIDTIVSGSFPLIHVECHGRETGLVTASGQVASWDEIRDSLILINFASEMNLMIIFAACHGAHAMSMGTKMDRAPFWAAIGPVKEVEAGVMEDSLKAFYETFFKTNSGDDAFKALNKQQKDPLFLFISSERFFEKAFSEYYQSSCIGKGKKSRIESTRVRQFAPKIGPFLTSTAFNFNRLGS
jgi:hypothetical protein